MAATVRLTLLVALVSATAAAQSRRYPPEPPDKDREEEAHSNLWEGTLDPNRGPYADLVREAEQLLGRNTPADTKLAIDKLGEAIQRMPGEPAAYQTRGRIYLARRDWAHCAEDLGAAEAHATDSDAVIRTRTRIDLAVCQARAGRLADAEQTLVRASSNAPAYRGELGLRLGETRIALGKLDEAIDALTAALDAGDIQHHLTRWLLVTAYDRARRPTEAAEQGELAKRMDPQRLYIETPSLPFLGAGDKEYMTAVAFRYANLKPEIALLYFREFLRVAPDSPWRRRAEEHVREISNMRLPAKDTTSSTDPAKVDDERRSLEAPMKTLRQCVAPTPMTAYQVQITKTGPRTPETARDRPFYRVPAPGVRADKLMTVGVEPGAETSKKVVDCLQAAAAKIKMPVPKERDTYYTVVFLVVSP